MCKPAPTPVETSPNLYVKQRKEVDDPIEYRRLVGVTSGLEKLPISGIISINGSSEGLVLQGVWVLDPIVCGLYGLCDPSFRFVLYGPRV